MDTEIEAPRKGKQCFLRDEDISGFAVRATFSPIYEDEVNFIDEVVSVLLKNY